MSLIRNPQFTIAAQFNTFAQIAFPGQKEVPEAFRVLFFAGYRNAFVDAMESAQAGDADAINAKAKEISDFFAQKVVAPTAEAPTAEPSTPPPDVVGSSEA